MSGKIGAVLGVIALAAAGFALYRTTQPINASVPGAEIKAFLQSNPDAIPGEAIRGYLMQNPQVVMEAAQLYERQQAEVKEAQKAQLLTTRAEEIFNDGYSAVLGNPDGDVTLVEFSDYNCGYCKRAHGEVAKFVEADGNIRLVIKEFPILGEGSVIAARAVLAAGLQDGADYGEISDALMTHKGRHTAETVMAVLGKFELDMDKLQADMQSDTVNDKLKRTYALAKELDINGTPAFIMGNELIPGYVPAARLEELAAKAREAG